MKFNANQFRSDFCSVDSNGKKGLTELQQSEKTAKSHMRLSHYTSFETLKLILSNKNWKFNRIDKVNDRLEHLLFGEDELSHLVFVSCFSIDEVESIPMWLIYGKDNNGLRISIELNKPDFVENFLDKQGNTMAPEPNVLYRYGRLNAPCSDWSYTVTIKDIIYDIDAIKRNPIRNGSGKNEWFRLTSMAAIKRREWQYEHECRMIATLRTVRDNVEAPEIDHILVPIRFSHIKKVIITFNPWMENVTKDEIRRFVNSIPDIACKTFFEDSILTGEIKEMKCFDEKRD